MTHCSQKCDLAMELTKFELLQVLLLFVFPEIAVCFVYKLYFYLYFFFVFTM